MLPILRRRPSQVLVALLCALVLSRMPAPVFAEETISSLVKIEESTVISAVIGPSASMTVFDFAIAIPSHTSARSDVPNHPLTEHSILRL